MKDRDEAPTIDHYDAFVEARFDRSSARNDAERKRASRQMWRAAAELLTAAAHGAPPPNEICGWVANAINDILAKSYPQELKDIMEIGGVSDNLSLRKAKITAAMYIYACRINFIEDKSPNKTVREAFEVSSQAVRDWTKAFDPTLWESFAPTCNEAQKRRRLLIALKHDACVVREHSRAAASIQRRNGKMPPS